jgi:acetyl-CoA/propionyl-CoA carboxylase biotin carboxyl carrier protein
MVAHDRLGTMTEPDITVTRGRAGGELIVRRGDRLAQMFALVEGETTWVFHDGVVYEIAEPAAGRRRGARAHGSLTAPMPATVIEIKVAAGHRVSRGDILILLEAMKMELPVRAPGDGLVTAVHCRPGQLVQPDTILIELE